jgi:hypothetical protein
MTGPHDRTYGTMHPLYGIWTGMRQRCNNPNDARFKNYGGRGITVCARWNSFRNFVLDVGARPRDHSLDRINNDLGYFPENVRWATSSQQAVNKRKPIRIGMVEKFLQKYQE